MTPPKTLLAPLVLVLALAAGCAAEGEKTATADGAAGYGVAGQSGKSQGRTGDGAEDVCCQGVVAYYNDVRGHGAITRADGSGVYVVRGGLVDPRRGLRPGDRVEFHVHDGGLGRQAANVVVVEPAEGQARVANQRGGPAQHGTVTWFNDARGYGFIGLADGTEVFVHFSAIIADGFRTLAAGDEVSFQVVTGPRGLQATNVVKLG